jgi:hypothetical protein
MNRSILSLVALTAVVSFTACDKNKARQKPVPGPRTTDTHNTTKIAEGNDPDAFPPETKKRDEVVDPTPATKHNIPPAPVQNNPEYAIKSEKPGYVKSPYDSQGRLIDVRGLPPGTEAECPYTRRTFLVPP